MTAPAQTRASLGGLPAAWMNLFQAQMQISSELYESVTGRPLPPLPDWRTMLRPATSRCRPTAGCCTIPSPCWLPQSLGHCTSHVSPCKTACLEFTITNCDRVARTIAVQATGAHAGKVTVAPVSIALGPMERGTITACIAVPDSAKAGEKLESLLWIRGCQEHFLRWTVSVGTAGADSCHEIEVCDCPDYIHHWYDHFYCLRPCPSPKTIGTAPNQPGRGAVSPHG
ncbi:MAG: hypothetical protein ACRDJK_06555 [Actinomycetota bacterium]